MGPPKVEKKKQVQGDMKTSKIGITSFRKKVNITREMYNTCSRSDHIFNILNTLQCCRNDLSRKISHWKFFTGTLLF